MHPTAQGAFWVAQQDAALISQLFPDPGETLAGVYDVYDATDSPSGNLLSNCPFQVTANGGTLQGNPYTTGSVATGWTGGFGDFGSPSGDMQTALATFSLATRTMPNGFDSVDMQQIAFSGHLKGGGETISYLTQDPGTGNLNSGDTLVATADVEFDSAVINVSSIHLRLKTVESGTQYDHADMLVASGGGKWPTPVGVVSGVMRTPARTLLAAPSGCTLAFYVEFQSTGGTQVNIGGNVRVGNIALRKI